MNLPLAHPALEVGDATCVKVTDDEATGPAAPGVAAVASVTTATVVAPTSPNGPVESKNEHRNIEGRPNVGNYPTSRCGTAPSL